MPCIIHIIIACYNSERQKDHIVLYCIQVFI